MNPTEFHNKFVKHENKSQGEYHAEFVEIVFDLVIDHLSTDYISPNNIREAIIKHLDAEYGEESE